jgi:hypothetical protein
MSVLLRSDCVLHLDPDDLKDATLRRIDQVINEDVDMQASCSSQTRYR